MAEVPTWEETKQAAAASKSDAASESTPTPTETASVEAEVKTADAESVDTDTTETSEPEIDHAKLLEEYKAKLAKTERVAERRLQALERISKAQNKSTDDDVEHDVEVPQGEDIETIVERKTSERLDAWKREQVADVVDDVLSGLSDSDKERELVRAYYENEIKPSGWNRKAIEADLKKAFLLANAPRFESLAFEKARAKVRRDMAQEKAVLNASAGAGPVGREEPQVDPNANLNDRERRWISYLDEFKERNKR